jgi:hypothetical protein
MAKKKTNKLTLTFELDHKLNEDQLLEWIHNFQGALDSAIGDEAEYVNNENGTAVEVSWNDLQEVK